MQHQNLTSRSSGMIMRHRSLKKIDTVIGNLGTDVTAETTCLLTLPSASRVTRRAAKM
jgi:hypothetical protein